MNGVLLTQGTMTRRAFISRATVAVGLTAVAGSGLRAQSANDKLNIAAIGAGGMGAGNIRKCAGENIVALCEVHCWSDRPLRGTRFQGNMYWPQGVPERPQDKPPVPGTLDWDLWLGSAPYRDYYPCYVPFNWRGWWDFGTGALGDMGCHIIDHPYWALKLGHPESVEASSAHIHAETAPLASLITYSFPARKGLPPVRMYWYDGGIRPPRGTRTGGQMARGWRALCRRPGQDHAPFPWRYSHVDPAVTHARF